MSRKPVHTEEAPGAIGTYSQAVACSNTVYLSGQIPLDPQTMQHFIAIQSALKPDEAAMARERWPGQRNSLDATSSASAISSRTHS